MAVWILAAAWLALIAFASSFTCPWLLSNRKGLLLLHWIFANLIDSSWSFFPENGQISSRSLLLPLATIGLIFEIATMAGKKEVHCRGSERVLFLVLIFSVDLSVILCARAAPFEVLLAIFSLLTYLGVYLCFKKAKSPHKMTMKEKYSLHSSDLFYGWEDPMKCLGLLGRTHFFTILALLLVQMNLYLCNSDFFLEQLGRIYIELPRYYKKTFILCAPYLLWLLFISRSFCTISMLGMPGILGAWVHTLKTFGRWWASRKERKSQMLAQDADDLIANVST
ncbi:unnamed protein product, partial [Mesorhabditis belari]|uniref:Transmembrane protein n=1 Tax=Mesorhabditis belari TaxID=2138241 RepID=A0AAF3EYF8_9BILA